MSHDRGDSRIMGSGQQHGLIEADKTRPGLREGIRHGIADLCIVQSQAYAERSGTEIRLTESRWIFFHDVFHDLLEIGIHARMRFGNFGSAGPQVYLGEREALMQKQYQGGFLCPSFPRK